MFRRRSTPRTTVFSLGKNVPQAAVFPIHGKLFKIHSFMFVNSLDIHRALKRTKGYSSIEDTRPTLRNKPSGLKTDWHHTVSNSPVPHQRASMTHARSSSSSMTHARSSSSSMLTSPSLPQSPLPEFDHSSSLLAISPPPIFGKVSSSSIQFHGNLVPLIDEKDAGFQEHVHSNMVRVFHVYYTQLLIYSSSPFPYLVLIRMTKAGNSSLD